MRHSLPLLAVLLTLPHLLAAAPPLWWASRGATNAIANPEDATFAANIGQMKHFASKAYDELQVNLPGGAGSGVEALIASWKTPASQLVPPITTRDDSVAATVSQLKRVGKLFYDRLLAIGYNQPTTVGYPITGFVAHVGDGEIINLAQLKYVFRFDVSYSSDGDSLPDWWEQKHFGNLAQTNSSIAPGNSVNNLTAFRQGRAPTAGVAPETGGAVSLQVFAPAR